MTRYEEADAVLPIFRDDYAERVYAGVLGKIIGVYAGRPFEQWGYDRIRTEIGNIRSYVNGVLGVPLVVTDDDITGTFTFIRAVADSGRGYDTTADDVAEAWLNYLVEKQSVLWWGGRSNSTEHTAYLQLKDGILPPESGSARLNGRVVSEQIGAQIFIEGWPLISPGSPQLAVTLARRAATVSHDGEAVCAAMCLAAMESAAFLPITIPELVEVGLSVIPTTSIIAQLIGDIRGWHHTERDWRKARQYLDTKYGYDVFGGIVTSYRITDLSCLLCYMETETLIGHLTL